MMRGLKTLQTSAANPSTSHLAFKPPALHRVRCNMDYARVRASAYSVAPGQAPSRSHTLTCGHVPACPVIPGHTRDIRAHPVIPGHTRAYPGIPGHTRSYPVIPGHTRSYPVIPGQTRSNPVIPGHTRAYPVIPGHTRAYCPVVFRSHCFASQWQAATSCQADARNENSRMCRDSSCILSIPQ